MKKQVIRAENGTKFERVGVHYRVTGPRGLHLPKIFIQETDSGVVVGTRQRVLKRRFKTAKAAYKAAVRRFWH